MGEKIEKYLKPKYKKQHNRYEDLLSK